MASLFKPTYAKVEGKTGLKVTRKSRKWYVKYRDADAVVRRVPGYTDKEATRQLAAELERKVAQRKAGLIDPYEDHRGRLLVDHLANYERHLAAKNDSPKHVKLTVNRILAALDGCQFRKIGDLSASRLAEWLADSRRSGMAVATSNYYLTALRGFTRWMVKDRRAGEDPLAYMAAGNVQLDRRYDRRSISDAEFARLVRAGASGESFRGLTGPDRATLYLTAAYTGLRAAELASLTPSSFDLSASPPSVTVEAAYSKRRRRDVLPLRPDLADTARRLPPWARHHDTCLAGHVGRARRQDDPRRPGEIGDPLPGCFRTVLRLPCPAPPVHLEAGDERSKREGRAGARTAQHDHADHGSIRSR